MGPVGTLPNSSTRKRLSGIGLAVFEVIRPFQCAVPSNSMLIFALPLLSTTYMPYSCIALAIVRHGPSQPQPRISDSLILASSWSRAPSGTSNGWVEDPSLFEAGNTNSPLGKS